MVDVLIGVVAAETTAEFTWLVVDINAAEEEWCDGW